MTEENAHVQEVDIYAGIDDTYQVTDEARDEDGNLRITIEVDGYETIVRDPNAASRGELLALCARTAQQVRYNRGPKQQ